MSANNPSTSRSRVPALGFLPRVPLSELKAIRVAVRRGNITTSSSSPGPIERSIDDPRQITAIVHGRKDDVRKPKPIFDRDDVVVNQEERSETRRRNYSRSKSRSPTKDRSKSSSSQRSRSSSRSRSGSRGLDKKKGRRKIIKTERRKSNGRERERSLGRDKDKRNLNRRSSLERDSGRNLDRDKERSLDRDRRLYKDRAHSREREDERYRKKSRTPLRPGEYRPSSADLRRRARSRDWELPHDKYRPTSRRSRSLSRERRKPSHKSPSPYYRKPSTSRKPSRSPRRSITPTRAHERLRSPRYGEASKNQYSRSPVKSEKPYYVEKRGRERSPGYKSPVEKSRRSRSPPRYERDRKRSRSPKKYPESSKARTRSSPGGSDRYSRRHSRSPDQYSRGPPSKMSRSTQFSRSDHRRSSRSPGYNRDRAYQRSDNHRRSRTRSPRRHRSRSPHGHREPDFAFYEGPAGSEFWIPGPIRPGFSGIPFYPPAFYPRVPGASILMPPRIPMVTPYAPFRPRLPIYNSSRPKPKVSTQTQSTSDSAVASGSAETNTAAGTNDDGTSKVTIQEVSDSESHRTEGTEKRNAGDDSRDE